MGPGQQVQRGHASSFSPRWGRKPPPPRKARKLPGFLCHRVLFVVARFKRLVYHRKPAGSDFWYSSFLLDLSSKVELYLVFTDLCAYGLQLPGAARHVFCKKSSGWVPNIRGITNLERRCPGIGCTHQHERAWGSTVVKGKKNLPRTCSGSLPSIHAKVGESSVPATRA